MQLFLSSNSGCIRCEILAGIVHILGKTENSLQKLRSHATYVTSMFNMKRG